MAFNRPDLQTLIDRIQSDIESRLPGADARVRRNVLAVLARVSAGSAHGLYGFIDWLSNQLLPDTAEAEYLERLSSIWGVTRTAATFAIGSVDFTGTDSTVIPAGTELQTSDGVIYTTDAEATIAAGVATVAFTAEEAGDAGDQAAGVTLSLVSPIVGLNSQATVAAGGLTGGADTEDDDSLRDRLLTRIQQPPHGGAEHDYNAWAFEAHPDVTRAWVYPNELGLGTVVVRIMTDDATADGIPQQTVIDAVQTFIETVRPVTADVTVVSPIAVPLDMTITLTPNSTAVQAAVQAELEDLIRREAEPGGTILISHIREAISIAAGETDHVLTTPNADVTHTASQIATLGAITWA